MKIDSIESLRQERKRLQLQLEEYENQLKKDVEWIKDELSPVKTIVGGISKLFHNKSTSVINQSIGIGSGLISRSLLSKSPWYIKLLLPILIKNISSNIVDERKDYFMELAKKWIHKLRTKTHHENGWYDSSTAQSHY